MMAFCLAALRLVVLHFGVLCMMAFYLVLLRFGCALLGGVALWLRFGCAPLGGALFWVVFLPFSTLSLSFCYSLLSLLCAGIKNSTRTRKGVRKCLGGVTTTTAKRHARRHQ